MDRDELSIHASPSPPAFKVPRGAVDAHCHIFGPADRYPYATDRTYTPADAPLSAFKKLQGILGLEHAVLVNASCYGIDNTVIVDAIAQSAGRYRGVANVDGTFSQAKFRSLHEAGFRAARFNFVKHLGGAPDMGMFASVLERIRPLGWHLDLTSMPRICQIMSCSLSSCRCRSSSIIWAACRSGTASSRDHSSCC